MKEYYAKSNNNQYTETLFSHLSRTLDKTEDILEKYNIHDENIIKAIKIASSFHDIGKADRRFQNYLIHGNPIVYHPLLAMPVVYEISRLLDNNNLQSLVLFSIASHHTPLHQELYAQVSDTFLEVEDKAHFEKIVYALAKRIGLDCLNISDCYTISCKTALKKAKSQYRPLISKEQKIELRNYFIIIQGILNYCDWLASGDVLNSDLGLSEDFIPHPYHYQIIAQKTYGNVFITLPTGSGKTETALAWIKGNAISGFRTFYTLPTTTTINAMYQRFIDKSRYGLSENVVSEYFSNVDLYLELEGQNPKNANLYLYKNFFYPLNVTTPDQLILALMNHGRYTLKSFMMKKALLVFDEIHAYDSETFGLIKGLIRHLHDYYEAKFCILSATFPNVLKKELSFLKASELIDQKIIENEYSRRKRTRIEFVNVYINQLYDEIIDLYRNGKKILIVMNTVKRAQQVYLGLKNIMASEEYPLNDIMLIHSRYTFHDRRNQERRLLKKHDTDSNNLTLALPRILVSTQIVEVSLDINYDALFTEACYLDSLVQRAGRINRNGNLGNEGQGLVRVCLPQGDLPYDSKMLNQSVKLLYEEPEKITSELDYIRLTNKFYDENWQSSNEAEERFGRIWRKVSYIYRADLSDIEMQKMLRTRSGIVTVNAYSRTHLNIISKLNDSLLSLIDSKERTQLYRQIKLYSINVPLTGSTRLTQIDNNGSSNGIKYFIVNSDYDKELGLMIDL